MISDPLHFYFLYCGLANLNQSSLTENVCFCVVLKSKFNSFGCSLVVLISCIIGCVIIDCALYYIVSCVVVYL